MIPTQFNPLAFGQPQYNRGRLVAIHFPNQAIAQEFKALAQSPANPSPIEVPIIVAQSTAHLIW